MVFRSLIVVCVYVLERERIHLKKYLWLSRFSLSSFIIMALYIYMCNFLSEKI